MVVCVTIWRERIKPDPRQRLPNLIPAASDQRRNKPQNSPSTLRHIATSFKHQHLTRSRWVNTCNVLSHIDNVPDRRREDRYSTSAATDRLSLCRHRSKVPPCSMADSGDWDCCSIGLSVSRCGTKRRSCWISVLVPYRER